MRFSIKGLAVALGLAWGGGVFLTGVAHQLWPSMAWQVALAVSNAEQAQA